LAAAVKTGRHRPYAVLRRRRPSLSARLAAGCRCLDERLNTRWIRIAGKMAAAVAVVALITMILGNSMQRSFTGEISRLSAAKQQCEKQHVLIQAELANLVQKNKDKLGLVEGKPEQLIRMN
jgi:type VI protein secretion system component VasF